MEPMSHQGGGRRAFFGPWFWTSLTIFGMGIVRVSYEARFWPSSYGYASRVGSFLIEGLAISGAAGLILGVLLWSVARIFRTSSCRPLITGCVWGFNLAMVAQFWIVPALI